MISKIKRTGQQKRSVDFHLTSHIKQDNYYLKLYVQQWPTILKCELLLSIICSMIICLILKHSG